MYKSYHYDNMPQPVRRTPQAEPPKPQNQDITAKQDEKESAQECLAPRHSGELEEKRSRSVLGGLKNDDIILLVVVFLLLMDECDDKLLLVILGLVFFTDFFA